MPSDATAMRLAPGESADLVWYLSGPLPGPQVTATIEGGDGAIRYRSLTLFREINIPYSEEELREFPAAMRERLRREGRTELVEDGGVAEGVPATPGPGARAELRYSVEAGAAKGRLIRGQLRVEGSGGGVLTAEVAAVVASGGVPVAADPPEVRLLVTPGAIARTIVTISGGPDAQVLALFNGSSSLVRVAGLGVWRDEIVPATPEELEQLPDDLREEVKKSGFVVGRLIAQAAAGEPVQVPAGCRLQIDVEVQGDDPGGIPLDGTLIVLADRWETLRIPVRAVRSGLELAVEPQRLVLEQAGGAVPLSLAVRVTGAAPGPVELVLNDGEEPWRVKPTTVPVLTVGDSRHALTVQADADSPLGVQPVDLFLAWFDGLGTAFLPLELEVRPGRVTVQLLTPAPVGPQGGSAEVRVRIDARAPKSMVFEAAQLPPGVRFEPPPEHGVQAGMTDRVMRLHIDRTTVEREAAPVSIAWRAHDGVHEGQLDVALRIQRVPDERRFERPIVTPPGMPLGGRVVFTLDNGGRGRFSGHMRATGALSYRFKLIAAMRSADGRLGLLESEEGDVHGTFDIGSRVHEWDRPLHHGFPPEFWPELADGQLTVARSTELAGFAGSTFDRLAKLVDILSGFGVLAPIVPGGAALAALVVAANDLRDLTGVRIVGPQGMVSLLSTAGASLLLGPGAIIPVFVGTNIVADALLKHREASSAERGFAEAVFGTTLPWDRILLTNMNGLGGRPFCCQNLDGQILVNLGDHLFADPVGRKRLKGDGKEHDWVAGQTFIHELVHAWQIEHGSFDAEFLWRGTVLKLLCGEEYDYGSPGPPFDSFSLEGMASLVEHWYAGRPIVRDGKRMGYEPAQSVGDRYFRYIEGNVRLGLM